MQKSHYYIASLAVVFLCTGLESAHAVSAQLPRKYYTLSRPSHNTATHAGNTRFIPLKHHTGRPLRFVPSGVQAIKNRNHESLPIIPSAGITRQVRDTRSQAALSPGDASQLLSIYEPVD